MDVELKNALWKRFSQFQSLINRGWRITTLEYRDDDYGGDLLIMQNGDREVTLMELDDFIALLKENQ